MSYWTAFRDELPPRDEWIWATADPKKQGIRMKPNVPFERVLEYYPHLTHWRLDSGRCTSDRTTVTPAGIPKC